MAKQEDTNMECVSRASSFTYCKKELAVGSFCHNLCLKYSPTYNAQRGDVHKDYIGYEGNYCGDHNSYWRVMCEDCATKLGIEW